ncbi:MAG TPA: hypothetical protein VMH80_03680 [Bryobacteraceae bacterium]|nr:hypothetical protein [Bryobacteraceae bacterium]
MTNDTKRKLTLWGGGIALFALFFGGSIRETIGRIMIMRQAPKPSPAGPPLNPQWGPVARPVRKAPEPLPANGSEPAPDPSFDRVVGVWEGLGPVLPNMCTLKLEIRRKEGDPAKLAGFPQLTCFPMTMPTRFNDPKAQQAIMARFTPMSAVLTGTADKGSVQFTVDKVIGKSSEGCAIEGMTVTPFGADQLSAEWKEIACQGGQLLLKKGKG